MKELLKHIHTLETHTSWIPYRTSYYSKNWGFCLSYNEFLKLKKDHYKVEIETNFTILHCLLMKMRLLC